MAGGARLAVLGGGVGGLACAAEAARALREAGAAGRVAVVERGARVGGRLAPGAAADAGAQYLTARSEELAARLGAWRRAGRVAEWRPARGLAALRWGAGGQGLSRVAPGERLVGVPAMAAVAECLAEDAVREGEGTAAPVEVLTGAGAARVRPAAGGAPGWEVWSGEEPARLLGVFDAVVAAMPPAEAAGVLARAAPALARAAAGVETGGCWAVTVSFERLLGLPFDGAFVNRDDGAQAGALDGSLAAQPAAGDTPPLSWVCRCSSKPGRGGGADTWVLHSSRSFYEAHRNAPAGEAARLLVEQFRAGVCAPLGAEVPPVAGGGASAVRWDESYPVRALDEPFLWDAAAAAGACGDWLGGARVEGAFLSGHRLGGVVGRHLAARAGAGAAGQREAQRNQ